MRDLPDGRQRKRGRAAAVAIAALQVADWIACVMFAGVFLIFNYKIFTRYFEHDEAIWADEVLVILFIWIIFWANAFLVPDRMQITFDLVYRLLPPAAKRAAALARYLLIGGIFAWAAPGSLDYIAFLWREHTPVLNLPLDYVYACFGLFMLAVIARSILGIAKVVGPRWECNI
jgi:TRAP-type C4-dicarboxylate transport system permease small subunit